MAYKLKIQYAHYRKKGDDIYEMVSTPQTMFDSVEMTAATLAEAEKKAKRSLSRKITDFNPTSVEGVSVYNGKTLMGSYIKNASGDVVFIPNKRSEQKVAGRYWYVITGTDRSGKRFKHTLSSEKEAKMYNIYRGTLWKEDKSTGKREKIYEWWN